MKRQRRTRTVVGYCVTSFRKSYHLNVISLFISAVYLYIFPRRELTDSKLKKAIQNLRYCLNFWTHHSILYSTNANITIFVLPFLFTFHVSEVNIDVNIDWGRNEVVPGRWRFDMMIMPVSKTQRSWHFWWDDWMMRSSRLSLSVVLYLDGLPFVDDNARVQNTNVMAFLVRRSDDEEQQTFFVSGSVFGQPSFSSYVWNEKWGILPRQTMTEDSKTDWGSKRTRDKYRWFTMQWLLTKIMAVIIYEMNNRHCVDIDGVEWLGGCFSWLLVFVEAYQRWREPL